MDGYGAVIGAMITMITTPSRTPQHSLHDVSRDRPSRPILQMNYAAIQAGLIDVTMQWPLHGAWDGTYNGWHWFDVMGLMPNRQRIILDLEPGYRDSRPTVAEIERYVAKANFCERRNWKFVTIYRGHSSQEIGVIIRKAMMETRNV